MFETVLAVVGALVCITLLMHMALPRARRDQVDAALRRAGRQLRQAWQRRGGFKGRAARVPARAARPAAPRLVVAPPPRRPPAAADAGEQARLDDGAPSETASAAARREAERKAEREAEQEALDIIERARRQSRAAPAPPPVARDGNVLRPDAFKPRPPEDRLH